VQTVSGLPGGTSAPNTVITEFAMSKYQLQPSPNGWLIQTPAPLTAAQISAARHLALGYQVTIETKTNAPSLAEFAGGATALAALGLLGAILGLAGALIAVLAWAHSNLSVMFGDVPLADVLVLLIGLPLIAAVAGGLLAGREPPLIARQPIE
jgi:putative ABC transport system permease protein